MWVDCSVVFKIISNQILSLSLVITELVHNAEPPAFEVLPTLKALKDRVIAASRGRYKAVFMSGRYVSGVYLLAAMKSISRGHLKGDTCL